MNNGYFLVGSNIGDRMKNLKKARSLIEHTIGTIVNQSSIYETASWGITDQPDFLNQVLFIETKLNVEDCMQKIFSIENRMGRIRTVKNASRVIDIDILFFNKDVIDKSGLSIPHAEIPNRRFVLVPMNELSPQFVHPVLQKTINSLLLACKDELEVKPLSS